MKSVTITTDHAVCIYIGQRLLPSNCFTDYITPVSKLAVIIDSGIPNTALEPLISSLSLLSSEVLQISLDPSERIKTRETKAKIEDQMLNAGFGRDAALIAIGGGIVTDLAGFIAATYCRGIPLYLAPTTTLSMIDASIGGKTGVNTPHGKNLIGAFYNPKAIFMDIDFLESLPDKTFLDGLAELVKHAALRNTDLFDELATLSLSDVRTNKSQLIQLLETSAQIKLSFSDKDHSEKAERACLNFGHTVGHAIEACSAGRYNHGQAVVFGMIAETHMAVQKGLATSQTLTRLENVCKHLGFHTKASGLTSKSVLKFMQYDKKNKGNSIHCSIISEISKPLRKDNNWTIPFSTEECFDGLKILGIS
jgi:3-dehydroquinate synthase